MRKSIALVIVALLIVPGAVAFGAGTPVYLTDTHAQTQLAKADISGCHNSECNVTPRVINVAISASIAQWANVHLNATDIKWQVLKPGDYYIDGIRATLQSNGDLWVDYEGFEDLINDEGNTLDTYYAVIGPKATSVAPVWVPAADLNNHGDPIPEVPGHTVMTFMLYNRIVVSDCKSACEYADPGGASITVILQEQKTWVAGM